VVNAVIVRDVRLGRVILSPMGPFLRELIDEDEEFGTVLVEYVSEVAWDEYEGWPIQDALDPEVMSKSTHDFTAEDAEYIMSRVKLGTAFWLYHHYYEILSPVGVGDGEDVFCDAVVDVGPRSIDVITIHLKSYES